MTEEQIKQKGKCCITGKPMLTSKNVNYIQLPYKAKWSFPQWGNLISFQDGMALAICHDDAIKDDSPIDPVKFAIEFKSDDIIYHDVTALEKEDFLPVDEIPTLPWEQYNDLFDSMPERTCRECGCIENDACHHPKLGNCWWVEADLCSHCYHWPGEAIRYSKLSNVKEHH